MTITDTQLVQVCYSYFSCSVAVLQASHKATEELFLQLWENQREQQFAVLEPHDKKRERDHLLMEQLFFVQLHFLQITVRVFERSVDCLILQH